MGYGGRASCESLFDGSLLAVWSFKLRAHLAVFIGKLDRSHKILAAVLERDDLSLQEEVGQRYIVGLLL